MLILKKINMDFSIEEQMDIETILKITNKLV